MSELAIRQPIVIPGFELPRSLLFPNKEHWKRFLDIVFMAGSRTNYSAKKQIEELLGGVAFSAPGHLYVGLWTSALSDTSTGSTSGESAYGSYARTEVGTANNQTNAWNASTGTTTATVTNKNDINFPTSTSGTSTITYLGILDATSTGNMTHWTDVASVTISSGQTPQITAGSISVVDD